MCQFFEKRGYLASVIQAAHHRAQQIDRQSALQTSQKEKNDRMPFTLTFHPSPFPTSGYHRQPQKSGAKIHFSNRHP